jgi:hypothetical protein
LHATKPKRNFNVISETTNSNIISKSNCEWRKLLDFCFTAIYSILFGIKPLKTKLFEIIFKDSVRTSKWTPDFTVTKINWLTLFKEIIAVYIESNTKPINTKWTFKYCYVAYNFNLTEDCDTFAESRYEYPRSNLI